MIRGAPIELAAAIICSVLPKGETVTTRFIAEFCAEIDPTVKVRHQDIYFIEHNALSKLRQAARGEAGEKPDLYYAREYGVSTGQVRMWRKAGAPLADPDAMGDFIFTIKLRKETRVRARRGKVVLA